MLTPAIYIPTHKAFVVNVKDYAGIGYEGAPNPSRTGKGTGCSLITISTFPRRYGVASLLMRGYEEHLGDEVDHSSSQGRLSSASVTLVQGNCEVSLFEFVVT